MQTAGLRYTVDATRPAGRRIVSADIVPSGGKASPLAEEERYRVVLPAYLARGGDGYGMLREGRALPLEPMTDVDLAEAYLTAQSPLKAMARGRIRWTAARE